MKDICSLDPNLILYLRSYIVQPLEPLLIVFRRRKIAYLWWMVAAAAGQLKFPFPLAPPPPPRCNGTPLMAGLALLGTPPTFRFAGKQSTLPGPQTDRKKHKHRLILATSVATVVRNTVNSSFCEV